MPTLPIAVAYIRMSSDKQEDSPEQQRAEIIRFAEGKYQIIRWYEDHGISGAETHKRPRFMQMIHDAEEQGDFSVILAWDQDRFGRFDSIDAGGWIAPLRRAGVRLETVVQGPINWQDFAGRIVYQVVQEGKHQYLKDLSKNVLRGRLALAKKGRWTGGAVPYGYALGEGGQLKLGDPKKVETVRWLFETYATTDVSMRGMAEELNARGVPSPSKKGDIWTLAGVQAIFRREAYYGRAVQFRRARGKFHTVRDGQIVPAGGDAAKPPEDWYFVECPPIVSRQLWDRVRAKATRLRKRNYPRRKRRGGLLDGLLFCAHCGEAMIAAGGGSIPKGSGKHFQCSTYHKYGSKVCGRNLIREGAIVDFLVPKIRELALSPENLDRLRSEVRRELDARSEAAPVDIGHLRERLNRLDGEVKTATRNFSRARGPVRRSGRRPSRPQEATS